MSGLHLLSHYQSAAKKCINTPDNYRIRFQNVLNRTRLGLMKIQKAILAQSNTSARSWMEKFVLIL